MRLNELNEQTKSVWEEKGYQVALWDREAVRQKTLQEPIWLHFGAGNIFRAFPAALQQTLLEKGLADRGIIACEGFDLEIIDKAYQPFDNRSLLVTLKANGTIEKKVIDSVVESLTADSSRPDDMARLQQIFEAPSLQMVSFTITEKGYAIQALEDTLQPRHLMGKVAALLYARFRKNQAPVAMVSMDNCSHNGDKLASAVRAYAKHWADLGLVPAEFVDYLNDSTKVTFPWSMIDKITPRPDAQVVNMLQQDGFEDTDIVITGKNTYTAAFVNAEETEYLVIEDTFPNGRPDLSVAGVLFTDRETVDRVEKMKVCTCLNPLHTSLAIFGCLLSYTSIHAEMKDPLLSALVNRLGYIEGMPVVVDPGILKPVDFLKAVLEQRLPNPFMPDTPQRIATDTSQKLPIRFGETIKAYLAKDQKEALTHMTALPLTLAGYCRYLLGLDDQGQAFVPSPDPLLSELMELAAPLKQVWEAEEKSSEMLRCVSEVCGRLYARKEIFGVDLYETGLGKQLEEYVWEMLQGPGAVRRTLQKNLGM